MEITIVSPLDDELQVWTLNLSESEYAEFGEKYGHRGASVLVSPSEVGEEIDGIWNEAKASDNLKDSINEAMERELRKVYHELGIRNGDIHPWDALEWENLTNGMASLFKKLVELNKE